MLIALEVDVAPPSTGNNGPARTGAPAVVRRRRSELRLPGRDFLRLRRDALGFFDRIHRERGDVAWFRVPTRRLVLLGHPDLARDLLLARSSMVEKGPALRSTRVLLGEGLLTAEGQLHL